MSPIDRLSDRHELDVENSESSLQSVHHIDLCQKSNKDKLFWKYASDNDRKELGPILWLAHYALAPHVLIQTEKTSMFLTLFLQKSW